ncbi:hypothetical protein BpHYR1_022289, partial [Brachionus plicatilis]
TLACAESNKRNSHSYIHLVKLVKNQYFWSNLILNVNKLLIEKSELEDIKKQMNLNKKNQIEFNENWLKEIELETKKHLENLKSEQIRKIDETFEDFLEIYHRFYRDSENFQKNLIERNNFLEEASNFFEKMNDWQQCVSKSLSNFRNFKDNEYKSKIDESSELIITSLKDLDQKFRLENNNEEFIKYLDNKLSNFYLKMKQLHVSLFFKS